MGYQDSNFLCTALCSCHVSGDTYIVHSIVFFHSYNTVMPVVTQQVASQIRVRDLSAAKVTLAPSESTSWSDARNELVSEAKASLRSELETSLAAAADEASIESMRKDFAKKEALIEHSIDSRVCEFNLSLDVTYNFLSK